MLEDGLLVSESLPECPPGVAAIKLRGRCGSGLLAGTSGLHRRRPVHRCLRDAWQVCAPGVVAPGAEVYPGRWLLCGVEWVLAVQAHRWREPCVQSGFALEPGRATAREQVNSEERRMLVWGSRPLRFLRSARSKWTVILVLVHDGGDSGCWRGCSAGEWLCLVALVRMAGYELAVRQYGCLIASAGRNERPSALRMADLQRDAHTVLCRRASPAHVRWAP